MHAKTNLSRLIERAEAGEDVVLARGQVPVARLVALTAPKVKRAFGAMKGRAKVDDAFFETLPEEELSSESFRALSTSPQTLRHALRAKDSLGSPSK